MTDPGEQQRREAIEGLRLAVADHQESIRAADLKAEVLALVLTALLAIAVGGGSASTSTLGGWLSIIAALAALIALVSVGTVLWPRSDPWRDIPLGSYMPSRVLYPGEMKAPGDHIQSQAQKAVGTDWPRELTYELAKLATISSRKRFWLRVALTVGVVSLVAVGVKLFVPAAEILR